MKLVSYLTEDFWPGLRVLAHSLKFKGGITGLDWIIMTESGVVPDEWYEWFARCGFSLISKAFSDVGKGAWPKKLPDTLERLAGNWNKLRILLLPEDAYIWLDTDMVCVNPATDLLYTTSVSAVREQPHQDKHYGYNLGLIRIDPDAELFETCVKLMKLPGVWALAEQDLLNAAMRERETYVTELDYRFNMPNYLIMRRPEMWKPDQAIFVHFMGDIKPWQPCAAYDEPIDGTTFTRILRKLWRDYAKEVS